MVVYRIIIVPTDDTRAARFIIMETRDDSGERVVSEHQTEDDAVQYLGELRERDFFWRKSVE